MYRNYPKMGGAGQDLGWPVPPGSNLEPPLGVEILSYRELLPATL